MQFRLCADSSRLRYFLGPPNIVDLYEDYSLSPLLSVASSPHKIPEDADSDVETGAQEKGDVRIKSLLRFVRNY